MLKPIGCIRTARVREINAESHLQIDDKYPGLACSSQYPTGLRYDRPIPRDIDPGERHHTAIGPEVVLHVHDDYGGSCWLDRQRLGPSVNRDPFGCGRHLLPRRADFQDSCRKGAVSITDFRYAAQQARGVRRVNDRRVLNGIFGSCGPDNGARRDKAGAPAKTAKGSARLDLFKFVPFRLNRLAAEVSSALSAEYQARYGLDIPEWRVLATLGFRDHACSAQYIAHCTRTHKSTISRAVTTLMKRQMIERVENADDRREFRLRMTGKGKALYEELIPRLLRREQEILSCLSASERKTLAALFGKIETSLDLVQTSAEADAKEAY